MPHFDVCFPNRNNAKRMRKALTKAELKLWNEIRAHRLMGLSFRRQMPIAGDIVGFACPAHRFVVEVDASQHGNDDDLAYDSKRAAPLEALGWRVLRFWNDAVRDMDDVCAAIIRTIGQLLPRHGPEEGKVLNTNAGKAEHV